MKMYEGTNSYFSIVDFSNRFFELKRVFMAHFMQWFLATFVNKSLTFELILAALVKNGWASLPAKSALIFWSSRF